MTALDEVCGACLADKHKKSSVQQSAPVSTYLSKKRHSPHGRCLKMIHARARSGVYLKARRKDSLKNTCRHVFVTRVTEMCVPGVVVIPMPGIAVLRRAHHLLPAGVRRRHAVTLYIHCHTSSLSACLLRRREVVPACSCGQATVLAYKELHTSTAAVDLVRYRISYNFSEFPRIFEPFNSKNRYNYHTKVW